MDNIGLTPSERELRRLARELKREEEDRRRIFEEEMRTFQKQRSEYMRRVADRREQEGIDYDGQERDLHVTLDDIADSSRRTPHSRSIDEDKDLSSVKQVGVSWRETIPDRGQSDERISDVSSDKRYDFERSRTERDSLRDNVGRERQNKDVSERQMTRDEETKQIRDKSPSKNKELALEHSTPTSRIHQTIDSEIE